MPTKPNSLPLWATQNPSNVVAPPSEMQATGYLQGQPLAASHLNSQLNNLGAWVQYLAAAQSSGQTIDAVEPAIRLIDGGRWSYTLSTTTLAWSGSFAISFAGLPDSQNQVAAGSATVPSGSVAYVNANAPFVDSGDTTSGSITVSGLSYPDQVTAGWAVSGAGIPSGATVKSIDTTAKSIVLSAAATATAAGVRLVFTGSGPLSVQVADVASFAPGANTVVIARAIDSGCIVGVGSGQMRLHDLESKPLLGTAYQDVQRFTAGEALTAGELVYLAGANDPSRQSGQVYGASGAANTQQRAQVLGVCLTGVAAGGAAYIVTSGQVPLFSGLSAGALYYLSASTVGALASTAPATIGQSVVQVGMALNATTLMLAGPGSRKPTLVAGNTNPLLQINAGMFYIPANSTNVVGSARYGLQPGGSPGSLSYSFSPEFSGTITAAKLAATLSSSSNWTLNVSNQTAKTTASSGLTFNSNYFSYPRFAVSVSAADVITFSLQPASAQANGNSIMIDFSFQPS